MVQVRKMTRGERELQGLACSVNYNWHSDGPRGSTYLEGNLSLICLLLCVFPPFHEEFLSSYCSFLSLFFLISKWVNSL